MAEMTRSILVIDDNPAIRRTLTRILNKHGYTVDTAHSGSEAIQMFTTQIYLAAVIDVGLGDMQGTDLLPQMHAVAPQMLRIILTGTPMSEVELNQAKTDADVFLLKPVKPETVLGILKERLGL